MDLYPAIDLRGGRSVRLYQGDFDRETVYGNDPVAVAEGFAAAGAPWIHVVDLDAARTGEPENRPVVAAIAAATAGRLHGAGGRRRARPGGGRGAAGRRRRPGRARHRRGRELPSWSRELAAHHQVAVGLDARGRRGGGAGLDGGHRASTCSTCWHRYEDAGVAAFVVTDIARDGTLAGPDLDGLAAVLDATAVDVIASGGVGLARRPGALCSLRGGRAAPGRGHRRQGPLRRAASRVEEAMAACAASG